MDCSRICISIKWMILVTLILVVVGCNWYVWEYDENRHSSENQELWYSRNISLLNNNSGFSQGTEVDRNFFLVSKLSFSFSHCFDKCFMESSKLLRVVKKNNDYNMNDHDIFITGNNMLNILNENVSLLNISYIPHVIGERNTHCSHGLFICPVDLMGCLHTNGTESDCVFSNNSAVCNLCDKKSMATVGSSALGDALEYSVIVVALVLHVLTLGTFAVVPALRRGCGTAVGHYVAAQALRKLSNIFMKWADPNMHDYQPFTIIFVPHCYTDLAAHAWQIVISYEIWTAFRPKTLRSRNSRSQRKFSTHCMFAWGVPALVTAVFWAASELYLNEHHLLIPVAVGVTVVLVVLELIPMAMSAATLIHLRAGRLNQCSIRGKESRRHTREVHWRKIYMKISLVTGADYIFLVILFLVDNIMYLMDLEETQLMSDFTYYTLWNIYNLKGVEMFFIFVLKKDICQALWSRETSSVPPLSGGVVTTTT